MKARVRFSRQARFDVIDIWRGIAPFNEGAANRIVDRIESACRKLRVFPDLGRHRPDIDHVGRVLIVDRWLVLYRVKANEVFILRVLDGRRDLTKIKPSHPA